jgi:DnaJ family protein C protein 11
MVDNNNWNNWDNNNQNNNLDYFKKNIDYYAILNVSKDANIDEIRNAYKKLAITYHPDHHSELSEFAKEQFTLIKNAYETLIDEHKRQVYDIYGYEGLNHALNSQIILTSNYKSTKELLKEYEKFKLREELLNSESKLNIHGKVMASMSLVDLVDIATGETNLPSVTKMEISQVIQTSISNSYLAEFGGTVTHSNGNGNGALHFGISKKFSSYTEGFAKVVTSNDNTFFHLGMWRRLSKYSTASLGSLWHIYGSQLTASYQRQLTENTTSVLSWTVGQSSLLTFGIKKHHETSSTYCELKASQNDISVSISFQKNINPETKLKIQGTLALQGHSQVTLGGSKNISITDRLGIYLAFRNNAILLLLSFHRGHQEFSFPILITKEPTPLFIIGSLLAPIVGLTLLKYLYIEPNRKRKKKKELEKLRQETAEAIAAARKNAESAIQLMKATVERKKEQEFLKKGLIIVSAYYGKLKHINIIKKDNGKIVEEKLGVIDVTIPLNYFVENSKLLLHDNSKSNLLGFYDPCIGEEKYLYIQYLFRDKLHETTVADNEEVRIPLASHLIK